MLRVGDGEEEECENLVSEVVGVGMEKLVAGSHKYFHELSILPHVSSTLLSQLL